MHLVLQVVSAIREAVPRSFIVGIKLNAADYLSGRLTEAEVASHIELLAQNGIDFIEVSGGDYENPGRGSIGVSR